MFAHAEPRDSSPSSGDSATILSFSSPEFLSFVETLKYCVGDRVSIFCLIAVNFSTSDPFVSFSSFSICSRSLPYAFARSKSTVSIPFLSCVSEEAARAVTTNTNTAPSATNTCVCGDSCGHLSLLGFGHRDARNAYPTIHRKAGPPIQLYHLLYHFDRITASLAVKSLICFKVCQADGKSGPKAITYNGGIDTKNATNALSVAGAVTSLSNHAQ